MIHIGYDKPLLTSFIIYRHIQKIADLVLTVLKISLLQTLASPMHQYTPQLLFRPHSFALFAKYSPKLKSLFSSDRRQVSSQNLHNFPKRTIHPILLKSLPKMQKQFILRQSSIRLKYILLVDRVKNSNQKGTNLLSVDLRNSLWLSFVFLLHSTCRVIHLPFLLSPRISFGKLSLPLSRLTMLSAAFLPLFRPPFGMIVLLPSSMPHLLIL